MKKLVLSSLALLLVTSGGNSSVGGQVPAPQGELRIVDTSLKNWISVVYNVMEHLVEWDPDGNLVPRLATGWRWLDDRTLEFTLRQGVTFHNGEVFNAEIVKLNWDVQFQHPRPRQFGLAFHPDSRLEIVDPYTVRLVFPEPDGLAVDKLGLLHMASRQFYRDLGWGEKHW